MSLEREIGNAMGPAFSLRQMGMSMAAPGADTEYRLKRIEDAIAALAKAVEVIAKRFDESTVK